LLHQFICVDPLLNGGWFPGLNIERRSISSKDQASDHDVPSAPSDQFGIEDGVTHFVMYQISRSWTSLSRLPKYTLVAHAAKVQIISHRYVGGK
jgi:hypothetical protein